MSCKCYSNGSFKGSFISKENISLKMKSQFEIETNKIDDFFLSFFSLPCIAFIHSKRQLHKLRIHYMGGSV